MKEAQICAVAIMLLLSLTLVFLLPRRVTANRVLNRSRWLIVSTTLVMAAQFLLQFSMGFRTMGITQAVMVNLIFFIPCSWMLYLAIVNLQKGGDIHLKDWLAGFVSWVAAVVALTVAALTDGQPLFSDTPELRMAEYVAGIIYTLLQGYYSIQLYLGNRRLQRTLSDYYDRDIDEMLRWMGNSSMLLAAMAVAVPFLIFSSGLLLLVFSVLILLFIYYLCIRFYGYCWSNASQTVESAQQNASNEEKLETAAADEERLTLDKDETSGVDIAVRQWVKKGTYLTSGITMPDVAAQIGVSQRALRQWYQSEGFDTYSDWLQRLRIDYAKHLLTTHSEYSFDAVAQECGFSSRSYFHKVFQKLEGITPSQFVKGRE
ncbi:MAG: helix-turn-helix transcriptional regulator [Prevotella sp.]|nr:helix-turn-helix transcriptional regulator [Prevotella sp.]